MEQKLPQAVRLKLQKTLARFKDWIDINPAATCPKPLQILGSGSNNYSVLVANSHHYVIRINRSPHHQNALDPQAEIQALQAAAIHRIAPKLRFADSELGCIVCDYLEQKEAPRARIDELARLLRKIHALPAITQKVSLSDRIVHYQRLLRVAGSTDLKPPGTISARAALIGAQKLQSADEPRVLCHNDLLAANLIRNQGQLWVIDWEYAAMGSRWFDLAVVCHGNLYDEEREGLLLSEYLRRDPAAQDWRMLRHARSAYAYLEWLWFASRDASSL